MRVQNQLVTLPAGITLQLARKHKLMKASKTAQTVAATVSDVVVLLKQNYEAFLKKRYLQITPDQPTHNLHGQTGAGT